MTGEASVLVTCTLLFLGFAVRSGVDVVRLVVWRRTATYVQRAAARPRLRFLLGFAMVLTAIYGVYLATLHR